jgi:restriction system protein
LQSNLAFELNRKMGNVEAMNRPAKVWLTRGGSNGEFEESAIESHVTGGGWHEVPDLISCTTYEAVRAVVFASYPEAKNRANGNWAGQLWALRVGISIGEIVVMPRKGQGIVAIGEVTSDYIYDANLGPERRHLRRVRWINPEVPKTTLGEDIQRSAGSIMTVCELRRPDIARRLLSAAQAGIDPGADQLDEPASEVIDQELPLDNISVSASVSISEMIRHRFPAHELSVLVEAVLIANGYKTVLSPPGPDQGVDVLAASGHLGFEGTRIAVQVKNTGKPIGVSDINQLNGAKDAFNANRALFVSWGGYTSPAAGMAKTKWFDLRLWTADDLVSEVTAVYELLPEEIRAKLPLRRIWTSAEESE